ncbi:glycosyltransferase family 39 protein [Leptolyngbya sp. FACHB-541]|uniref:glycosyltransferase family 39 protein n=1 Tax=Leptolyngbya sp. FACHB-541 TaxID=2692810 RepID=UPI001687D454|nr:glycosyltransferase family 39 protein [Leptolyngbya sp. FACHB-541]MBD2000003.1 glycosyltransferase family 39 protein [Leptolyngbya sp. FACHB-541]
MMKYEQPWIQGLKMALAIVIVFGVLFRLVNLDQKPYWHDETYTSLRISGFKIEEVMQLFNGQIIDVEALRPYQQVSPEHGAIATIQRIAEEDSQHTPLYFVIVRAWAKLFGSSIVSLRSLSVVFSILSLPFMYWLCVELFALPLVGWMATALMATAPIYIRYAQEARPYSMWILLILITSTFLLKAIRQKTTVGWGVYAIAMIAALYCHVFSVLVLVSHGMYVLAIQRFRLTGAAIAYLMSASIAVLSFLPWLRVMWMSRERLVLTTNWAKVPLPFTELVKSWSLNLCHAFVSIPSSSLNGILIGLSAGILLLIAGAVYYLQRRTRQVWILLFALMGVTTATFLLPDLVTAGRRSAVDRYFFICYLGIHLTVAYLLASQLVRNTTNLVQLRLWQVITVILLSGSILSNVVTMQADTWWGWSEFDVKVAEQINQSQQPLVISDMPFGGIMPVGHRLHSNTKLLLLTEATVDELQWTEHEFSDVFVYNPSDRLQSTLTRQGKALTPIYQFRDNTLAIALYHVQPSDTKIGTAHQTIAF